MQVLANVRKLEKSLCWQTVQLIHYHYEWWRKKVLLDWAQGSESLLCIKVFESFKTFEKCQNFSIPTYNKLFPNWWMLCKMTRASAALISVSFFTTHGCLVIKSLNWNLHSDHTIHYVAPIWKGSENFTLNLQCWAHFGNKRWLLLIRVYNQEVIMLQLFGNNNWKSHLNSNTKKLWIYV